MARGCSEDRRRHTRVHDQGCERAVISIKFDTQDNFEQGTGADVMGAKIFYALGYNTAGELPGLLRSRAIVVDEKTEIVDYRGITRN